MQGEILMTTDAQPLSGGTEDEVERVARAIYGYWASGLKGMAPALLFEENPADICDHWRGCARAALSALSRPSPEAATGDVIAAIDKAIAALAPLAAAWQMHRLVYLSAPHETRVSADDLILFPSNLNAANAALNDLSEARASISAMGSTTPAYDDTMERREYERGVQDGIARCAAIDCVDIDKVRADAVREAMERAAQIAERTFGRDGASGFLRVGVDAKEFNAGVRIAASIRAAIPEQKETK